MALAPPRSVRLTFGIAAFDTAPSTETVVAKDCFNGLSMFFLMAAAKLPVGSPVDLFICTAKLAVSWKL